MAIFDAEDVIQFAIRMEENGEKFYRDAERAAKDAGAKQLFKKLAEEEVGHKATFEKMLSKITPSDEVEDYQGEYMANLRDYVDGRSVFEKGAMSGGDASAVLDAAIQRELNAVAYYTELKNFVAEDDFKVVDEIVDEERRHFAELSNLKRGKK